MSERRSRDHNKRRDRKNNDTTNRSFLQAPIILDRRERPNDTPRTTQIESASASATTIAKQNEVLTNIADTSLSSIPFLRRPNKFNADTIKSLTDHPGHFVIGIIGKQGVGKSTILSHFGQDPEHTFSTQSTDQFLTEGHKTNGIDMYITPERAILLDTEPISCWTVLDDVLRNGTMGGLHPDLWLEMESIYNIMFMFSVCNVVLIVNDGPQLDMDVLQLVQRAEMLKFCIPDFPLLVREQDMQFYPDIVFVANKCTPFEFTWKNYNDLQILLNNLFQKSQLKTQGTVNLGNTLPLFRSDQNKEPNLFFLPEREQDENNVESFDVLISALRDQVLATPRRSGKKSQVSEKDWYRNAVKTFEVIRKSEYIGEYLQLVRKLRDS